MSHYQVILFYVSFTQLQQWTEFTMNDVEHCLMWTLGNYIIVNFTWILNDIWMDVKWFEWNFNKQFKEWNISSVIILLPSNPAQRLPRIKPVLGCTVTVRANPHRATSSKLQRCRLTLGLTLSLTLYWLLLLTLMLIVGRP